MLRQRNARCTGNVPNSIQSESLLCDFMIYRPVYLGDGYWVIVKIDFSPINSFIHLSSGGNLFDFNRSFFVIY